MGKQGIKEGANRDEREQRQDRAPGYPTGCCLLRCVTGTWGEQGCPRVSSQQAFRGSTRGADSPEGRGSHQRLGRPRCASELPLAVAWEDGSA